MNISRQTTRTGTMLGYTMISLHKVLLTRLMSAVASITINTAHAEVASAYGGPDGFCGSRTANGERVNCSAMCHHGCVVVRINDRGPFIPGRHIDLTPAAARAIGLNQIGQVSISR